MPTGFAEAGQPPPHQSRDVIIQGGAFGEHQFTEVRHGAERFGVDGQCFRVSLRPGTGGGWISG